jgi:2-enoate reductase
MQAAYICGLRGHEVILFEKDSQLGGLVEIASSIPRLYTKDLYNIVRFLKSMLKKIDVEIRLNETATAESIIDHHPNALIVATGSVSALPEDIEGIDAESVFCKDDYLKDGVGKAESVVVVGAGRGAELSVSLARRGLKVTIMDSGGRANLAVTPYITTWRMNMLRRFISELNIPLIDKAKVVRIADGGIVYKRDGEQERMLDADHIVFATSRKSVNTLYNELKGKLPVVEVVGDAVKPRCIRYAIHEATDIALRI